MGEARTGDGEGTVAPLSRSRDFFLHLPQISQLILSGLGNSRVTRMSGKYNHKLRVFSKEANAFGTFQGSRQYLVGLFPQTNESSKLSISLS